MLNSLSAGTFFGCGGPYEAADLVLFGAPFDSTASFRPGARFASAAMRGDSIGLETYSPVLDRDLADIFFHDAGDLELCIGEAQTALRQVESYTAALLQDKKRPVLLGGEHLVTLGALRALHQRYPNLHVLHFDAHADLRDEYLGAKLSHATVMRRAWELLGDGKIHQFGIRSGERGEFAWANESHVSMHKFGFDGLAETMQALRGKPVYLTLDLDVLDPSVLPGTGTPEPGGVDFHALTRALRELESLNIAGFDIVELSPPCDPTGASTAVACKLLREMLLLFNAEFGIRNA